MYTLLSPKSRLDAGVELGSEWLQLKKSRQGPKLDADCLEWLHLLIPIGYERRPQPSLLQRCDKYIPVIVMWSSDEALW
jgi:hypothetical protein